MLCDRTPLKHGQYEFSSSCPTYKWNNEEKNDDQGDKLCKQIFYTQVTPFNRSFTCTDCRLLYLHRIRITIPYKDFGS